MTRQARQKSASGDYEIGYGKPPVGTQFQPGRSGNPKGRPKGLQQPKELLLKLLAKRISANDGGRQRTITMLEVVLRNIVSGAANRDPKSIHILLKLLERFDGSSAIEALSVATETSSEEDAKILDAYLAEYQAKSAPPMDAETDEPGTNVGSSKEDSDGS